MNLKNKSVQIKTPPNFFHDFQVCIKYAKTFYYENLWAKESKKPAAFNSDPNKYSTCEVDTT